MTSDSFEDYMRKVTDIKLGPMSRLNLTPPKKNQSIQECIMEACAEGARLIALEEKNKPVVEKVVPPTPSVNNTNPYVRARNDVLKTFNEFQLKQIADMESGKREKNYVYDDFVAQVRKLGDQYSA